jgi:hypothetical protein
LDKIEYINVIGRFVIMLCGPFILYTSLLIPMPDGSDCAHTETAVTVFASATFFLAGITTLAGFCSGQPGPCFTNLLISGILVAIAPFAVYIVVVLLVLLIPTLAAKVIRRCLYPTHKVKRQRPTPGELESIFPDVRIDNPS